MLSAESPEEMQRFMDSRALRWSADTLPLVGIMALQARFGGPSPRPGDVLRQVDQLYADFVGLIDESEAPEQAKGLAQVAMFSALRSWAAIARGDVDYQHPAFDQLFGGRGFLAVWSSAQPVTMLFVAMIAGLAEPKQVRNEDVIEHIARRALAYADEFARIVGEARIG